MNSINSEGAPLEFTLPLILEFWVGVGLEGKGGVSDTISGRAAAREKPAHFPP